MIETSDTISLSSFEELFREHYSKLCAVSVKIVNDKNLAEDLVQDVFLKVWENKNSINITSNAGGYFYKMVCNASLNHIGKKKIINFSHTTSHDISNIGAGNSIESTIDYPEFQKTVYNVLDSLPPKCKTIFVLSRFEDLKYKEIAEKLDISVKTVESQMGIAIKRLNNDLKPILIRNFPDIVFSLILLKYLTNLF